MSALRKYDEEFRERAVRMYREELADGTGPKLGARKHVGALHSSIGQLPPVEFERAHRQATSVPPEPEVA